MARLREKNEELKAAAREKDKLSEQLAALALAGPAASDTDPDNAEVGALHANLVKLNFRSS
jgi:hypothetical protein